MHVLQLTESQLTTLATVLNKLPEREYHHAALFSVHLVVEAQWKRARRPAKRARVSGAAPPSRILSVSDSFISVLKDMVRANSWWDTVDTLSKTIGYLVQVYPHLADEMEAWSKDEDFWVRRVSLLHQVRRGSPAATHHCELTATPILHSLPTRMKLIRTHCFVAVLPWRRRRSSSFAKPSGGRFAHTHGSMQMPWHDSYQTTLSCRP